jgi:alanine racemase
MGVYSLAVADLFEAVNLRISGIEVPILVYASHLPASADKIIKFMAINLSAIQGAKYDSDLYFAR